MNLKKSKKFAQLTEQDLDFKIACVTGQMAAGKNFISNAMEKKFGCISFDLDVCVHTVIKRNEKEILDAFSLDAKSAGIDLLSKEGTLDRRALGKLIFSDKKFIKKQENLVYPKVIKATKDFINKNSDKKLILNAALLYKTPELLALCEKIFFVRAPFLKRLWRAVLRDKISIAQILKRFRAQRQVLLEYQKTGKQIVFIKN
ncbi:dephospho-CoA kinase [Treponema pectinovorum]|uniref:dephospho-CoA kinase n=1 Tax=Treponema pectinovorum TaxID=164 RepID=UPI003D929F9F